MSKFRSLVMLRLAAFLITILSCVSVYSIENKDIQTVLEKEGYKAAFILLKQLAEQGDPKAQFELGAIYYFPLDESIKKDINEAFKWYTKAALQGQVEAQYNLGVMYDQGKGVPKNYSDAYKWYKLAAEQGFANAQYNLGVMYDQGYGIPKNYAQAIKWYKLAAEQGFANAQYNLGVMYYRGEGIPKNYIDAYKWFNIVVSSEDKVSDAARALMNINEPRMTSEQIATAQNLAKEWVENH